MKTTNRGDILSVSASVAHGMTYPFLSATLGRLGWQ